MSTQQLKQKGFTIIEVVLVLAIAALIFLMVFIALPALQRNQRDTARKTVLGKVASAVTTYQSNNRGNQPGSGMDLKGYVDGSDATPDTVIDSQYTVKVSTSLTSVDDTNPDTSTVQVVTHAKCGTDNKPVSSPSARNAAIIMRMENGNALTCQDV